MFESIYKKRKNPIFNMVGWGLLIFVCLIFIFVGYSPDMSFLGTGGAVAEVNGEPISVLQFQQMFDRIQKQQKSKKLSQKDRARLQKQVVDNLVSRSLILQKAKEDGIMVSDVEVANFVKTIPAFQDEGKFSLLKYKEIMKSQAGLTAARFEKGIATDILVQRMYGYYEQMTEETPLVEKHEKGLSNVKFNLDFIQIPSSQLVTAADITPQKIAEFKKTNAEKVSQYYQKNVATNFTEKEQVKAQHILVKIDEKRDQAAALERVNKVASELTADNFDELAKKYSDDPGSKNRGGHLGFFSKGRMVPEFEKSAFSLAKGATSEPVKTSYGYHIIRMLEKKEARIKELAEVEDEITSQLIKEGGQDAAKKEIVKVLEDGPKALNMLVAAKKWKWQNTGPFGLGDPSIPKLGRNDDVLDAMVRLTKEKPLADNIIIQNNNVYIIRLKDVASSSKAVTKAASNMDFFKQIMKQQRSNEMFQKWIEDLKQNATVKINNNVLR